MPRLEVGRNGDEGMRLYKICSDSQTLRIPKLGFSMGCKNRNQGRMCRKLVKSPRNPDHQPPFPCGCGCDGVAVVIANHYSLIL